MGGAHSGRGREHGEDPVSASGQSPLSSSAPILVLNAAAGAMLVGCAIITLEIYTTRRWDLSTSLLALTFAALLLGHLVTFAAWLVHTGGDTPRAQPWMGSLTLALSGITSVAMAIALPGLVLKERERVGLCMDAATLQALTKNGKVDEVAVQSVWEERTTGGLRLVELEGLGPTFYSYFAILAIIDAILAMAYVLRAHLDADDQRLRRNQPRKGRVLFHGTVIGAFLLSSLVPLILVALEAYSTKRQRTSWADRLNPNLATETSQMKTALLNKLAIGLGVVILTGLVGMVVVAQGASKQKKIESGAGEGQSLSIGGPFLIGLAGFVAFGALGVGWRRFWSDGLSASSTGVYFWVDKDDRAVESLLRVTLLPSMQAFLAALLFWYMCGRYSRSRPFLGQDPGGRPSFPPSGHGAPGQRDRLHNAEERHFRESSESE